ncbi:MFS transporter [Micromonospora sp. NPDC092111]|uniref:MFS transporter n=1 Tax=Micromonospora sp. NPDC092111 TaxID=3364289 RepID=UPI0037FDB3B7
MLCLANFLILLDTTIVNTAAPHIMAALHTPVDGALWVLNGYLLAFASLLITFGRLGDRVGPRRVFVVGLAVFSVASVWCALSRDTGELVAARVLQGIGAAALLPQALVLISAVFPAHRRGAAFGIFTAVAGVAAVSGPTLGGLLVTAAGWQSVFYLNVPVGLAGLLLAARYLPRVRPARAHRFDAVGVALATGGLLAIVFGLVEGQRYAWDRVLGPVGIPHILVAGVALLVLFVWWERRAAEPLLPLDLFGDRNFTVATVLTVISSFALYGFLFVFVLETQNMLGMSPLASGLAALPWTVTLSAVAPVAGRLADRVGGRILLMAGLAVQAVGVLGVAVLPGPSSSWRTFAGPLVAIGVGMGLSIAPTTTEAMRGIIPQRAGAASGLLNTARQAGAALGAALIGAVLQNRLPDSTHRAAFRDGFATASRPALAVVAGVLLAGAGLAAAMRRRPRVPVRPARREGVAQTATSKMTNVQPGPYTGLAGAVDSGEPDAHLRSQ